jgi:hypothetical protein
MVHLFALAAAIAVQQAPMLAPVRVEAIGPKQDDPRAACGPAAGRSGIIVQGGREAIGPKQDDPRKLAIGPKQDDPLHTSVLARPGDDNDPKASGGSGIIIQGGIEAIGPKQDDPRAPGRSLAIGPKQDDPRAPGRSLAIGPKQDDPRAPAGTLARPGDDDDPHARAAACEVMQR